MRVELGIIQEVRCGLGGYQDAMIGYGFTLSGSGWVVRTPWEGVRASERSERAQWTESDRIANLGAAMIELAAILNDAKVLDISDLKGKPIEAAFEDGVLKSWRILKEVL